VLYQILAMAKNRVIGKNNALPWHFPSDFKHFKDTTLGQTVLMGLNTYKSLPKLLPGRENFVLNWTTDGFENQEHLKYFDSIEKALAAVKTGHCFVIGGASLYRQTLEMVDGIYLTHIDQDFEGDAYYPELPTYFVEKSRHKLQDNPKLEVVFYQNTKKKY
jgi:dihydrofolate reductase